MKYSEVNIDKLRGGKKLKGVLMALVWNVKHRILQGASEREALDKVSEVSGASVTKLKGYLSRFSDVVGMDDEVCSEFFMTKGTSLPSDSVPKEVFDVVLQSSIKTTRRILKFSNDENENRRILNIFIDNYFESRYEISADMSVAQVMDVLLRVVRDCDGIPQDSPLSSLEVFVARHGLAA